MPEHLAAGGIKGIELVIGASNVDHSIDDGGATDDAEGGGRSALGEVASQLLRPDLVAVEIGGVLVAIEGAPLDQAAGDHRLGEDRCSDGVYPVLA